jgi:glucokinase
LVPLIESLIDQIGGPWSAIGVGCAGLVDHRSGTLRWMPHAAGRDISIGPALAARYGVPVWVDNDANAAALAEATVGAGQGHRMVLMLTLGTGIGAGLVIDGVLERGRGHLGEVGHMRLADGPHCECGRDGCWETLVSGTMLDEAGARLDPPCDGAGLVARSRSGDARAMAIVAAAARWLGIGIGNLVLALDPDVVVIGGAVAQGGDDLLNPARRYLVDSGGSFAIAPPPPLVVAALGAAAGLEGAMIGATEVLG